MLDESWAIDWWLPRHKQKLKEKVALVAIGTPPELVFIGDCITQGWETEGLNVWQRHYAARHALALDFGGGRTENVLWRLQHGEIDGIRPKVAVLIIGTNNTGHRRLKLSHRVTRLGRCRFDRHLAKAEGQTGEG